MKADFELAQLSSPDFQKWDNFVDSSPQGDVFCYSWWLDTITKGKFKLLAVLDKDEIVAGIPLAYYYGKINEPPLTRTLGPLFKDLGDISEHDKTTFHRVWLNLLLDHVPFDEVEQFCTSRNFTDWLPFRWRGYKQTTRYTYLIDYYGKDETKLWLGLNRGKKGHINKAYRNHLSIKVTNDLRPFYQLVELTYKRQNLEFPFSFDDFKQLDDEIIKRDKRKILTVFDENDQPHAAIYIVFNHKSAFNLLSAEDPHYRHLGGHILVMWEAIKYFRGKVRFFNFGGSNIERIENHMRGFGGVLTPYFHILKEQPVIREIERIKKVEVIKEIPVLPAPPPDDWRYHVKTIFHHVWVLIKKALYKIHVRFKDPVKRVEIIPSQHDGKGSNEMQVSIKKQLRQSLEAVTANDRLIDHTADPVFSIITPTNRRPQLLKRAVKSVVSQSFSNWELIIVDDANDPESAKLVAQFNDPRIKYIAHKTPRGASGAYNTGMKHAQGCYINFLDDDDEYLPNILEKLVAAYASDNSDVGFIWTGVVHVRDTDDGEITQNTMIWPADFPSKEEGLMNSTGIGNGFGLCVKRKCVENIGYYDETLAVGVDTDFLIRLSKIYTFKTIPEVLVKIHHHANHQLTSTKNAKVRWEVYKKLMYRYSDFLSNYWGTFYIHNKAYANLCYQVNEKQAGRLAMWTLIRKFPDRKIAWLDFISYELFKKDYDSSKLKTIVLKQKKLNSYISNRFVF